MTNLFITGATGFIGQHLTAALRDRGRSFIAIPRQGFPTQAEKTGGTLIHLANDHASVARNVGLASEALRFAQQSCVETVIFVQTFASLTGRSKFDPKEMNCGFAPRYVDLYTAGKIAVERHIVRVAPSGIRIIFVYLPAVIGEGGSWDRLFSQLGRFQRLLIPIIATARANHIAVGDVVERLLSLIATDSIGGSAYERSPRRLLWCSDASRSLEWPKFIAQHVDSRIEIEPFIPWLRFSENLLANSAYSVALSMRLPEFIRRLAFSRPSSSEAPEPYPTVRSGVWSPGPFLRLLMCEQTFIPSFPNLKDSKPDVALSYCPTVLSHE